MFRPILAAGIVFMAVLMVREIANRRTGKGLLTRRHFAMRLASGLMAITVLSMMLIGHGWLSEYSPVLIASYWTVCLLLTALLVVLALLDLRQVAITYGENRKRVLRDLTKPGSEDGNGRR